MGYGGGYGGYGMTGYGGYGGGMRCSTSKLVMNKNCLLCPVNFYVSLQKSNSHEYEAGCWLGKANYKMNMIKETKSNFLSYCSSKEGDRIGFVPINYVKIVGRTSESPPLAGPIDNLSKFESSFKST
uniref:SH3 domain-containing protein n=1 Tax=Heterorhabditis bacteriophora TaxID=37862 RepID=A0A1I7XB97_HETBA